MTHSQFIYFRPKSAYSQYRKSPDLMPGGEVNSYMALPPRRRRRVDSRKKRIWNQAALDPRCASSCTHLYPRRMRGPCREARRPLLATYTQVGNRKNSEKDIYSKRHHTNAMTTTNTRFVASARHRDVLLSCIA